MYGGRMDKQVITISVNNDTTEEEINEIRQIFRQSDKYKNHTLNIIICGHDNFKQNIKDFIKAGIKS